MSSTRYTLIIILCVTLMACIALAAYFTEGFRTIPVDANGNVDLGPSAGLPGTGDSGGSSGDSGGSSDVGGPAMIVDAITENAKACRVNVTNGGRFSVQITVSPAAAFEFIISEDIYKNKSSSANLKFLETDVNLNEIFDVKIYDGYFTLDTTYKDISEILGKAYPGRYFYEVQELPCYFLLTVTSQSGATNTQELPVVDFAVLSEGDVELNDTFVFV